MSDTPGSPRPLDAEALERLLASHRRGAAPDDLLDLYAMLSAASAPAAPGAQPGEAAALAVFRESIPVLKALTWRTALRERLTAARLAVVAATSVVVVSGGLAAAATGALPDSAQQVAHDVLNTLGVHVPGPANQTPTPAPTHSPKGPDVRNTPAVAPPRGNGDTDNGQHTPGTTPSHPAHPTHPIRPSAAPTVTPSATPHVTPHPTPDPHVTHGP